MHTLDDAAYGQMATDLAHRFSDTVTPDEAQAAVAQARGELEPQSRHPEFLGILVTKRATDLLRAAATGHGERLHHVPTVLFACEHNRGRSQMAAAFAHHLGGRHVHVRATGRQVATEVDPLAADVMAEKGIDLEALFRSGPLGDPVHAPDVLVDMGAEIDVQAKSRVSWDVRDPHDAPLPVVRAVRDDIEGRVRGLLAELGVTAAP